MLLNNIVHKYGPPDAIIDYWQKSNKVKKLIYGLEDIIKIYHNKCLINDKIIKGNPFIILQDWIEESKKKSSSNLSTIGYINYNFKDLIYKHINFKNKSLSEPLLWFARPKKIIPFDECNNKDTGSYLNIKKDLIGLSDYKKKINEIKSFIKSGYTYQINYTQPKEYILKKDPFKLFLKARQIAQPPFGYYLNTKDMQIISLSPELFFSLNDGIIQTKPMKGTRPNNGEPNNKIEIENLRNSIKDQSEHIMIVDLLRNDLGKICNYNSIKVKKLFEIKTYKSVHQMISTIYGQTKNGLKEIDIIKALFPCGSVTGAPKEKSMEIIDQIENYSRGIYTGSIGYIKKNGDMNFNVAIRTLSIRNNLAIYPVGGGIVWDSKYIEEWNEAQQKSILLKNL